MQLKYVPKSGTASDVAGIVSATMFRNTVSDNRIVTPANTKRNVVYESIKEITLDQKEQILPSESFSPESGGKVKPSKAMEAISTHGTIRLKK